MRRSRLNRASSMRSLTQRVHELAGGGGALGHIGTPASPLAHHRYCASQKPGAGREADYLRSCLSTVECMHVCACVGARGCNALPGAACSSTSRRAWHLQANEILHHKLTLNGYLSEFTGQSMEQMTKDTDRDFFMSPQECVEYGLIDAVITKPTLAALGAM